MKSLIRTVLAALVLLGTLAGCARMGGLSAPDTDIYESSLSD